jgi:hypothetical protein
MLEMQEFSKVLSVMTFSSKCVRPLTFENVGGGGKALATPLFGGEFEFEVLTVNPGPVLPGREAYQDAAFVHKVMQ